MKVPFCDLKRVNLPFLEGFTDDLTNAVRGSEYTLGDPVRRFEEEFAQWLGVPWCVGVSSGTDALRIAMHCLGNKQLWMSAYEYVAAKEAAIQSGHTIRFVDEEDFDALDLTAHMHGHVKEIKFAATIEDAAQALGCRHKNNLFAGTLGQMGCFSFYPTKNLGALGDGGAIVGHDPELEKQCRILRDHGQTSRNVHVTNGYTARLHALQAAFLRRKLRHLDTHLQERRKAVAYYESILSYVDSIQFRPSNGQPLHLMVIQVENNDTRYKLREHLADSGVETQIHYPEPLAKGFPKAQHYCDTILSLPLFYGITREEQDYVCDTIKEYFKRGH